MSSPDLKAFLGGFLVEAEEHLRNANAQLLLLDEASRRGEANHKAVRELFRSMHTVKGLAGMVGVDPIVDVSHAAETILRAADRSGGRLSLETVDLLLRATRAIEERVRALESQETVQPAPPALIQSLEKQEPLGLGGAAAGDLLSGLDPTVAAKLGDAERQELLAGIRSGRRAVRVDFVPSAALAEAGINITSVRERLGRIADIVKVVPLSLGAAAQGGIAFALLLVTDADDAALAEAASSTAERVVHLGKEAQPALEPMLEEETVEVAPASRRYVRVDVARLDDALERLSSLVVTRSRLERAVAALASEGTDVRSLSYLMAEHGRQLRDLRAAIVSARMIRVSEILERVPLVVRGLTRQTGKAVNLHIDAGNAEVDKAVGERIFPAVVHLVRNAIDHGLEAPEARRAAGKPEEGRIEVTCTERSNNRLELRVSDDGRGIDRAAVAKKAGREIPGNEALLSLLATPGFSTREQTTTTSGRGMGVDIVQRIARDLGGELELETEAGKGTTFTLVVPLTITIVDAFSLVCAGQTFAVPVSSVDELIEVAEGERVRAPGNGAALLRRRGEAIPLVDLAEILGLEVARSQAMKAMVIRRGGEPFAFAVDRMLGQQEVVVRPLADPLVRRPGIAGSTDLGDGRPTLLLDLAALRAELIPEMRS